MDRTRVGTPGPGLGAPGGRGSPSGEGAARGGPAALELGIESIAAGGDGVGREPGGRVLFIPRTAPGDRVRATVVEERPSYARGRVLELLRPGGGRRAPPCSHYVACGGCQLLHLEPGAEREAKRGILRDALRRIGGLELEVPPLTAPGPEFGYRNRITLTLRRGEAGVVAGYHRYDDPARLVDVEDCPLAEPAVREAWRALRAGWGDGAARLPAGREIRLTLRGSVTGRVALLVEGGDGGAGDPVGLRAVLPQLRSYHWRNASGRRRRLAGAGTLRDRWSGRTLRLWPEAFLQVNRRVAAAIDAHLERRLSPGPGRRMLDLYAGVATRSLGWSLAGAEVAACEVSRDAVRTARAAARRYGSDLRLVEGRVEDHLDRLLPADVAVVNPPRGGLSRPVADRLARGGVERLAYVSCDAATLARDLRRLAPGWTVEGVRPFDAFPHTAHVETVAWLRWTGGGRG